MDIVLKKENNMYFKGSLMNRNIKSYYGKKLDVLKSGVQKYLRRRELDKMVWCVVELYLFKFADERGYVVLSNLINRFKLFLDEELVFYEVNVYLKVMRMLERLEELKRVEEVDMEGLKLLVKMCRVLVGSNMLRLNSDVKKYFEFGVKELKEVKGDEKSMRMFKKEGDEEENVKMFGKFVELFNNKDDECFYYGIKLMRKEEEGGKGALRFKRRGCSLIVWEFLERECKKKLNGKLMKCFYYRLKEYYKNRGEKGIFMISVIHLLKYYDEVDWCKNTDYSNLNVSSDFLNDMFKKRGNLEIDSYAVDMHTSEGRKKGKNKKDFVLEGSLVKDECKRYYVEEWRTFYIEIGIKNKNKKRKRMEKYKKIKKIRQKPAFKDLEKDLDFIPSDSFDPNGITLCSDTVCGNKVMCFEYSGKIYKEGRRSMNYNRDYVCFDECKELFGLEKIGMRRLLSDFRVVKVDKSVKSWKNNWKKERIVEGEEKVVYCEMKKVGDGVMGNKIKEKIRRERVLFKEFVKIGVVRGIFRVSDFNMRNVLVNEKGGLVSIDEGDIGKRLNIIGGREKWMVNRMNEDKSIVNEILKEVMEVDEKKVYEKMMKYNFNEKLWEEVKRNWKNVKEDLIKEGILF